MSEEFDITEEEFIELLRSMVSKYIGPKLTEEEVIASAKVMFKKVQEDAKSQEKLKEHIDYIKKTPNMYAIKEIFEKSLLDYVDNDSAFAGTSEVFESIINAIYDSAKIGGELAVIFSFKRKDNMFIVDEIYSHEYLMSEQILMYPHGSFIVKDTETGKTIHQSISLNLAVKNLERIIDHSKHYALFHTHGYNTEISITDAKNSKVIGVLGVKEPTEDLLDLFDINYFKTKDRDLLETTLLDLPADFRAQIIACKPAAMLYYKLGEQWHVQELKIID